jgi:transcriptional regulator with XRE-family HTH domain
MSTIGGRLKEERKRLGIDQADFGEKCGVSKKSQSNYELDHRSPDALYLAKALEIGVDIHYVLQGTQLTHFQGDNTTRIVDKEALIEAHASNPANKSPERDFAFYMEQLSKLLGKFLPDSDLAIFLNANRNTFSSWKRNNRVPYKELIDFCDNYDFNMNWFFTGKGEIKFNSDKNNEVPEYNPKALDFDLLVKAITEVLLGVETHGKSLTKDSIGKMIAVAYESLIDGKGINQTSVKAMLKLF